MKKALLIVVFIATSLYCNAQKDYLEGYIVTNNYDTIHGFVKDRKSSFIPKIYKKIHFKPHKGSKKRFKPNELISYNRGGINFESIAFIEITKGFKRTFVLTTSDDDRQFLQVIIKGDLSLYHSLFVDYESGLVDFIPLLKRQNGQFMKVFNLGIFGLGRKKMAAFFQDYPDLKERIENGVIKNPEDIVQNYNNWKRNNSTSL